VWDHGLSSHESHSISIRSVRQMEAVGGKQGHNA
jgi:hypothetical protein